MPFDGLLREIDESRGVAAAGNCVVVVPREDDEALLPHEREGLRRKRTVADDIAEAHDLLGAVALGVVENSAKSGLVRMYVGDDRVLHLTAPSAARRRPSREAGG